MVASLTELKSLYVFVWLELIGARARLVSFSLSHILFRLLHGNRLEGTIPSDIGQLAALAQL